MGIGIIEGRAGAVLYCNTSMWAFGPVFESEEQAQSFLHWLGDDPRSLDECELDEKHRDWLRGRWLDCDSDKKHNAFLDWLVEDVTNYDRETLQALFNEWDHTVWDGKGGDDR